MGSPVGERGTTATFMHTSRSELAAGGFTETIDENFLPGSLSVHVGLSRFVARAPSVAAIGIIEVRFIDEGPRTFGPTSLDWAPQAWGNMSGFTWAIEIVRGEMTGWMFLQSWR